ncbi:MAG: hypothetical protein MUF81_00980 [Verrucomicrobia bacterium]|nr:hypothetical protein [Verrucomicrobiota bacterium]
MKTPTTLRVTRGLQETAGIAVHCRPDALTGRVFKQALKSICRNAAILGALSLVLGSARAGEPAAPQTAFLPRTFDAETRNGEIVGWEGQTRRVFVTRGTNEFFFVVPQRMRVEVTPDKVALVSGDATYFLTFRILSPGNADAGREFLVNQFPNAKVVDEFSRTAAGQNGPALELRYQAAGGMERAVWVALIPSTAGLLEFCLNADPPKAADGQLAFNSLLRTFRSNENGKLEITTRVLDQS